MEGVGHFRGDRQAVALDLEDAAGGGGGEREQVAVGIDHARIGVDREARVDLGIGRRNSSVMVSRLRRTRLPVLPVRTKPRLRVGSMLK